MKPILAALMLAAAAALPIAAASQPPLAAPAPSPLFLKPADYAPDLLLPPPPKDGSAKALAELAEVRAFDRNRTPAQLEQARHDDEVEDPTLFEPILGIDLKKLPATAKLLTDVQAEGKAAAKAAKDHFLRNRPWIIDPSLNSCAKADAPQSSYPSGHATFGFSEGVILARLMPAKAPALLARMSDYADNRLVCGMHFRSDVVAGQTLGTAVALKLLDLPAFRAEYDAAAQELAKAGY